MESTYKEVNRTLTVEYRWRLVRDITLLLAALAAFYAVFSPYHLTFGAIAALLAVGGVAITTPKMASARDDVEAAAGKLHAELTV